MRITLRELSIFMAVYRAQQLSKAAKRLSLSIPAVSQAIRELEEMLGDELFTRTNQGVAPTEAGDELFPLAEQTLLAAEEIETVFRERQRGEAGVLRIGTDITYGNYVLSRKLPTFKQRHSSVALRLKIIDNDRVEDMVAEGRLDIGFLENPPENETLEGFPCFEDRKCIFVSRSSPLCHVDLTEKELSDALWFLYETERLRNNTLRWLKTKGIQAKNRIEMTTLGAIKRAVSTGQGAAVLPYLAVKEELDRGDLIELMPPHGIHEKLAMEKVYAVYSPKSNPKLRELFFSACDIAPLKVEK